MDETEASLIRRCQAGEKDAFGPLVRKYAGAASGAAYMILGCYDEAMDASQEAFVRAWRAIHRFDAERPFFPWLRTILRNVCLGRLRSNARRPTQDLPDGCASAATDTDPVLLADCSERADRVWRAVMSLPLAHREVILMNHFQNMSYSEIADALGVPVGTVMSRLYYARRALRDKLPGEES